MTEHVLMRRRVFLASALACAAVGVALPATAIGASAIPPKPEGEGWFLGKVFDDFDIERRADGTLRIIDGPWHYEWVRRTA